MAPAKEKPAASPRPAAGSFSRIALRSRSREPRRRLSDHNFADLNHRGDIGVVLDVAHDLLAVLAHPGLEGIERVHKDVAHSDIGGRRAGSAARNPLVHGVVLAGVAETFL